MIEEIKKTFKLTNESVSVSLTPEFVEHGMTYYLKLSPDLRDRLRRLIPDDKTSEFYAGILVGTREVLSSYLALNVVLTNNESSGMKSYMKTVSIINARVMYILYHRKKDIEPIAKILDGYSEDSR